MIAARIPVVARALELLVLPQDGVDAEALLGRARVQAAERHSVRRRRRQVAGLCSRHSRFSPERRSPRAGSTCSRSCRPTIATARASRSIRAERTAADRRPRSSARAREQGSSHARARRRRRAPARAPRRHPRCGEPGTDASRHARTARRRRATGPEPHARAGRSSGSRRGERRVHRLAEPAPQRPDDCVLAVGSGASRARARAPGSSADLGCVCAADGAWVRMPQPCSKRECSDGHADLPAPTWSGTGAASPVRRVSRWRSTTSSKLSSVGSRPRRRGCRLLLDLGRAGSTRQAPAGSRTTTTVKRHPSSRERLRPSRAGVHSRVGPG